eukprot:SAG31_NODE_21612_length_545_cov_1.040359_1_plen_115_part_00
MDDPHLRAVLAAVFGEGRTAARCVWPRGLELSDHPAPWPGHWQPIEAAERPLTSVRVPCGRYYALLHDEHGMAHCDLPHLDDGALAEAGMSKPFHRRRCVVSDCNLGNQLPYDF